MGTDRRGPLAAFIVVAIIAVILLVTSVRSQAAPGWLDGELPSSVVAVVPSTDDGLLGAIGDGMDQLVEHGTVLVHKATAHHSSAEDISPPASASIPEPASSSPSHRHASSRHPTGHGRSSPRAWHPDSHLPLTRAQHGPPAARSDTGLARQHGRHLGWVHGHYPHGHARGHGHWGHLGWTVQLPGVA